MGPPAYYGGSVAYDAPAYSNGGGGAGAFPRPRAQPAPAAIYEAANGGAQQQQQQQQQQSPLAMLGWAANQSRTLSFAPSSSGGQALTRTDSLVAVAAGVGIVRTDSLTSEGLSLMRTDSMVSDGMLTRTGSEDTASVGSSEGSSVGLRANGPPNGSRKRVRLSEEERLQRK
jgi:hypothetical protein